MAEIETDKPAGEEADGSNSSVGRATIGTFGATLAIATLALVNASITSHGLGVAGRGELVYLTVLANMTMFISTFGIEVAHGNILGQEPQKARVLATNSVVLGVGLTAIVSIAIVMLMLAVPSVKNASSWDLVIVSLASVPFVVVQTHFRWMAITDRNFFVANFSMLSLTATTVVINGALVLADELTVTYALLTWIAGQLIAMVWLGIYVAKQHGFGAFDPSLARRAFKFGIKNHLTGVMQLANFRLDQIFVQALSSKSQLGLYSAAVAFAETLFYLPQAVAQAQRPELIRADSKSAAEQAAQGIRMTWLVTWAFGLILVLAAPLIVKIFFGDEFADATLMLQLLIPGALGVAAAKVLSTALVSQDKPLASALPIGLSLLITVGLDILLIPSEGGNGAAIASTIAYLIGGVAISIVFLRVFALSARQLVPRAEDLELMIRPLRKMLQDRRSR